MKILASDYDGTLRTEEYVAKKEIEAIQAFRAAGNKFGIVSGRSIESMKQEIERNQIAYDFIVTNNGGVVYDQNMQLLQCLYMDYDSALSIISYIKTLDCVSYVVNDGFCRHKFVIDENQIDHKYGNIQESKDGNEILKRKKIAQIVISLNDDKMANKIAAHINAAYNGKAVAYVNVHCVDIVPHGVSKAEGLLYIENHLGFSHDDIYTIGDSYNDLPMLHVFHGSCVANAPSDIQEDVECVYQSVADCIYDLMK